MEEKPGRICFCNSGLDALGPGDCCRAEAPRNRAKCRFFGFSQTTDCSCQRTPQQHGRAVRECFIHGNLEGFQSTLRRLDHADQSFIHKKGRHRRGTDGRRQRGNLKLSGWSLPNPDGGLIRLHRKVHTVPENVASSADMLARRHVIKAFTWDRKLTCEPTFNVSAIQRKVLFITEGRLLVSVSTFHLLSACVESPAVSCHK